LLKKEWTFIFIVHLHQNLNNMA